MCLHSRSPLHHSITQEIVFVLEHDKTKKNCLLFFDSNRPNNVYIKLLNNYMELIY